MKRSHKLSIVYIVILLTGLSLWQLWKSSRIIEDPAYTKGVVNELYKVRATPYFSYLYTIDKKTYKGNGKRYGEYESLQIGDTITVYYQKSNPNNSEAYIRKNKLQAPAYRASNIYPVPIDTINGNAK